MCFFLVAGCASEKKPTARISNADLAIQEAREANAINYSPLELKLAEDKLNQARAAADKDKNREARRLADEAFADAKTAEAQARSEKTRQMAQQMRESVAALQRELSTPPAATR
jgi:hypothetical protein